jgi:hypothetical protein
MDCAKSSNQQNNQISERIDTLKREIHEKIAVNEGRILLGKAINMGAAPIGLGMAAGATVLGVDAAVLGGAGALVVGGIRLNIKYLKFFPS